MKKVGLLLAALSLFVFTGCDFKKQEKPEEPKEPEQKEEVVNVISFFDGVADPDYFTDSKKSATVKIPKIDSTKPNAVSLNNKILAGYLASVYDMGIYAVLCNDFESCGATHSVDYQYVIKNDVIAISVKTVKDSLPSSGDASEGLTSYFYDIKNDKELTIAEAMPKLGLTYGKNEKECGYFYIENGNALIGNVGMGCGE